MKKLIIRVICAVLIGVVFNGLVYMSSPHYYEKDIYCVEGICEDVYIVNTLAGKTSGSRSYLIMEDGEYYRLRDELKDYLQINFMDLKGEKIVFWASDKSIFWLDDHQVVALEHIKEETLKKTNQQNFNTRLILMIISLLMVFLFLLPQILRVFAQRDAKKETAWIRDERESKRKRIVNKHLPSSPVHKVKPPNMSMKKWKQIKKNSKH